jgi:hypothetical protein
MKSSHALILAVGLGLGGAVLNSYYLYKKSQAVEKVDFVGIASEVKPGERLLAKQLVAVPVPKKQAEILDDFAFRFEDRETVINRPVSRLLRSGSLLMEDDLKTPPQQLELGQNELAWPIPVDTRAFVPSLIKPGDEVWFLGAAPPVAYPTPASDEPVPESEPNGGQSGVSAGSAGSAGPPGSSASAKIIGPFTVLALGNRLGSAEVMRAARIRQVQENVMLVKVTMERGSLKSPAKELLELLEATNSRPLGYFWRPRREENK